MFTFLVWYNATAQNTTSTKQDTSGAAIIVGLHGHYGFIIPHSSTIREISNSYPFGIEADISVHFTNAKAWHYTRGYPRLGASIAYYNFNNPEVLGNAYALIFFAEPFISAHKQFSMSFRLGTGVAYMNKPYDPEINPQNLFYSTSFSFPLVINLMANYRLNERYMLRAGFSYNHISNGGLRQPNKGINFPTVTAGINYALRPAEFKERLSDEYQIEGKKRHYLVAIVGSSQDSKFEKAKQLPLLGIVAYATQRIGRLSALAAGAEWIANFSLREELRRNNDDRDFQRGAILAGHELQIGKFRFNQLLGIYVYSPFSARDPVYQRYGLEYHTNRKLFFGINLKAHLHVADFVDARVGFRF